jgi:hypothetical protein
MRRFGQRFGRGAAHTGHADSEARAQEIGLAGTVQIDLGIDGRRTGELDLPLRGGEFDRADIAGRPGGGEQVLGGRMPAPLVNIAI